MLKDYKGRAAVEQGEAFDPSPANIESRTQRVTLPNGLKLVMLPKKTRGGTVTATLALHYGDEKSVFDKGTAAQFAGAMLMRGTQKHTRQQLQDELDTAEGADERQRGGQRRESERHDDSREHCPGAASGGGSLAAAGFPGNANSSSCGKRRWAASKAA